MTAFLDFDLLKVGDCRQLSKTITDEDIRKFVELTGDDNPLHVDQKFARETAFKDIVVHGMLGASFISTVIGTQLQAAVAEGMALQRRVRQVAALAERAQLGARGGFAAAQVEEVGRAVAQVVEVGEGQGQHPVRRGDAPVVPALAAAQVAR